MSAVPTTTSALRRRVFVAVCAIGQLAIWLVVRPDLAGPQWSEGSSTEVWLLLEAGAALLVGVAAPDGQAATWAVVGGWGLQAVHFGFFGEHYDDTLWGMAFLGDAVFAALAVGLALLVVTLRQRAGRRRRAG
ncbi:MAG: hypothetical protein JWP40_2627 [Blastococcus sp.]|jgi:hypothetical protein|nr:hypothetical protein [Blastococcus sp.]